MDTNTLLTNALTEQTMNLAMKDKLTEYENQQKDEASSNKTQQNKQHYNDDKGHRDRDEDEDDDFMDADEKEIFEKMKQDRLRELTSKQVNNAKDEDDEYEETNKNKHVWQDGEYTEIVEQEFLKYVTKAELSACHFYHKDFERCKIIDKHLQIIAPKHKECKFIKLDAEKAPFFITKLAVKMLPTICLFKNGVLVDQIVGFEELGSKDDFKTMALTRRLVKSGVIKPKTKEEKGIKITRAGRGNNDSDDSDDGDF